MVARVGAVALLLAVAASCVPVKPAESPTPASTTTVPPLPTTTTTAPEDVPDADCRIAAVGDIVGENDLARASATADLIVREDVDAVLLAGDLAYPGGTYAELTTYFHPTLGVRLQDKLWPTLGNHELDTGGVGYFQYFADLGRPVTANYVTRVCGWNIVSVDSEGAIDAGAQLINSTRQADPNRPMLVLWHIPRYSSGLHGSNSTVSPLWDAAVAAKAEVINGHDHNYERVQVGSTTEFIVGTGGHSPRSVVGSPVPGSQMIIDGQAAHGALFMHLEPDGNYTFEWKYVDGTVGDSGSGIAD